MAVDNAGHHILAAGIDHADICARFQPFADGGDLAAANQDVRIFQSAMGDG